jgi:heat shock protein HtpX
MLRRALLALVGAVLLAAYAAAGLILVRGFAWLWSLRPDPVVLATGTALGALVAGYLSYRLGTARLLASLSAVELTRRSSPNVHRLLDRLVDRMAVERPRVAVASLPTPNVLAVGGAAGGVVVVDRRLFDVLGPAEFEAVLAHELAHLERYDALVQTVAYTLVRTVHSVLLLLAAPVVVVVLGLARGVAFLRGRPTAWSEGPVATVGRAVEAAVVALLLVVILPVRAHSRRREFAADERAAEVADPRALAAAIRTIDAVDDPLAALSPLYTRGDDTPGWFSTHPDTDARVERLRRRARETAGRRARVE